jgi:hypothetical protein
MPFLIGWDVTILWMVFVGSYVDIGNFYLLLEHSLEGGS